MAGIVAWLHVPSNYLRQSTLHLCNKPSYCRNSLVKVYSPTISFSWLHYCIASTLLVQSVTQHFSLVKRCHSVLSRKKTQLGHTPYLKLLPSTVGKKEVGAKVRPWCMYCSMPKYITWAEGKSRSKRSPNHHWVILIWKQAYLVDQSVNKFL